MGLLEAMFGRIVTEGAVHQGPNNLVEASEDKQSSCKQQRRWDVLRMPDVQDSWKEGCAVNNRPFHQFDYECKDALGRTKEFSLGKERSSYDMSTF